MVIPPRSLPYEAASRSGSTKLRTPREGDRVRGDARRSGLEKRQDQMAAAASLKQRSNSRYLLLFEALVAEVEGAGVLGDGTDDRLVEALGSTGGDLDGDLDVG